MIVVDTSVWVDFFNGQNTPEVEQLDRLLSTTPILIGDLILVGLLQGFRKDKDFKIAQSLFAQLPQVTMSNPKLALKSAEYFRSLRKRGITVRKTIDCLIATYCIHHQYPLLYADRDFDPFVAHLQLQRVNV